MIAKNIDRFEGGEQADEIWGRIYDHQTVRINQSVLCDKLQEGGFNFDEVKSVWAREGYLIKLRNDYSSITVVHGVKARYVQLALPKEFTKEATEEH